MMILMAVAMQTEQRKIERSFDDKDIIQCLEQGVRKLGRKKRKYVSTPFVNSVTVRSYKQQLFLYIEKHFEFSV